MGGKGGIFNLMILLAIVLAAVSIFIVIQLVNSAKEQAAANAQPAAIEMAKVLVAATDIEQGSEIRPEMVPVKDLPKEFVPPDALDSFDKVAGRVASGFIPAGDILFNSKLRAREKLSKPSLIVEKGKRLISVPVTDTTSVSSLIKIGDRVDVIATFDVSKFERDIENEWISRQVTTTVLQNVRVFDIINGVPIDATAATTTESSTKQQQASRLGIGSTATYEVSPQDAERVKALLAKSPSFTMTLRRYDDEDSVKTSGVVDSELLKGVVSSSLPPPPPTPAPVAPVEKPAPTPKRYY